MPHLHQHLQAARAIECSQSTMWKRFCLKMRFWTVEMTLSRLFSSSTSLCEVTSIVADLVLSTADRLHLAAATACTTLWHIVWLSVFTCSM